MKRTHEDQRPICELTCGNGKPCPGHTTRRCGTCGRYACAAHSRKPWNRGAGTTEGWLCRDCEKRDGTPMPPRSVIRERTERSLDRLEVVVRPKRRDHDR